MSIVGAAMMTHTSSLNTCIDALWGLYRLVTYGPDLWMVRAVAMSVILWEPKKVVVAATTIVVTVMIALALLRYLVNAIVEYTVRVVTSVFSFPQPVKAIRIHHHR